MGFNSGFKGLKKLKKTTETSVYVDGDLQEFLLY